MKLSKIRRICFFHSIDTSTTISSINTAGTNILMNMTTASTTSTSTTTGKTRMTAEESCQCICLRVNPQRIEKQFLFSVPPSSLCVTTVGKNLLNNSFLYSPTSQTYAAGMLNNQFGVYQAYGYGNVTSTAIWTAPQTSTSLPCKLALQTDRNLVVYLTVPTNGSSVLWTAQVQNNGTGTPFCLQMLDTGYLIWINSTSDIIWQSNSTVTSG